MAGFAVDVRGMQPDLLPVGDFADRVVGPLHVGLPFAELVRLGLGLDDLAVNGLGAQRLSAGVKLFAGDRPGLRVGNDKLGGRTLAGEIVLVDIVDRHFREAEVLFRREKNPDLWACVPPVRLCAGARRDGVRVESEVGGAPRNHRILSGALDERRLPATALILETALQEIEVLQFQSRAEKAVIGRLGLVERLVDYCSLGPNLLIELEPFLCVRVFVGHLADDLFGPGTISGIPRRFASMGSFSHHPLYSYAWPSSASKAK